MTTTAPKAQRFEGHDVAATAVKITRAGDGLSAPLTVAPELIKLGETRFILLEVECADVAHKPIKDSTEVTRVHSLRTLSGTLVDAEVAEPLLNEMKERVAEARANDPTLFGDVLVVVDGDEDA